MHCLLLIDIENKQFAWFNLINLLNYFLLLLVQELLTILEAFVLELIFFKSCCSLFSFLFLFSILFWLVAAIKHHFSIISQKINNLSILDCRIFQDYRLLSFVREFYYPFLFHLFFSSTISVFLVLHRI